jgi:shikimate dehydrogenase
MHPHIEALPWSADTPFPADAVLYDLVYNPAETALMRQASAAGARAIGGLGMLVQQGALSFDQWTGIEPPLAVMEEAARMKLELSAGN